MVKREVTPQIKGPERKAAAQVKAFCPSLWMQDPLTTAFSNTR